MNPEEKTFEQLLASLAEKEKRAAKRASLFTAITLLVGLLLLAILFFEIVQLRRTKAGIEQEVKDLEIKKAIASHELAETNDELAVANDNVAIAKEALKAAQPQLKSPEAQQALTKVNSALKTLNTPVKDTSTKPPKIPVEGVTPGPTSTVAKQSGFLSNWEYAGKDKTVITVTVTPEAVNTPRTLFTYTIDGKNYFETPPGRRLSFTLDKRNNNPTKLVLFLDFKENEPGGYAIVIEASDGNRRNIHIAPPASGSEKIIHFSFAIM
jgi:hypothetical protein